WPPIEPSSSWTRDRRFGKRAHYHRSRMAPTRMMPGHSPYLDPAVASTYERIAAPFQFSQPAHDLVDILRPEPGSRVLDVGTGTGIVALNLRAAVRGGTVVGADPSIEMLQRARPAAAHRIVAGRTPGLPFRENTFDVVSASFVVSHLENYQ